jgi:hypothetical protein
MKKGAKDKAAAAAVVEAPSPLPDEYGFAPVSDTFDTRFSSAHGHGILQY